MERQTKLIMGKCPNLKKENDVMKKVISIALVVVMVVMFVGGCAITADADVAVEGTEAATSEPAQTEVLEENSEPVTLKMWIWFPSVELYTPVIEAYEKEHPNVKIELSVMESLAYQQKLPIALATEEEIDICGVQIGAMVGQIENYLTPMEDLLTEVAPDWQNSYNAADLELLKNQTSDGTLKFLTMVKLGSMMGYYNADIFAELGLTPPKTIEEYKAVVDTINEKMPDVMPVAFAGKDAWFQDEMMQTVAAQNGDYINKWRYENAPYNSEEMLKAYNDYKKFFDLGVFTMDVMDLDYAMASDKFLSGQAATFFNGTWDAGLLSQKYRDSLGAQIGNVGAFALPVVDENGSSAVRAFVEVGIGVVKTSKHPKEAADFIAYLVLGDGMQMLGQNFIGIPSKTDFMLEDGVLTSDEAVAGYKLITELTLNAKTDRNNVSDFSNVVGAAIQNVILGQITAEQALEQLQKEWESGKYSS
jgi:raffinose/stachyose/melibiose transport system substrate-binding protein